MTLVLRPVKCLYQSEGLVARLDYGLAILPVALAYTYPKPLPGNLRGKLSNCLVCCIVPPDLKSHKPSKSKLDRDGDFPFSLSVPRLA